MYALQFSKLNSIVWNKNIIWILLWRFCFYGCFKKNYFKSRFNLSIIYKRVRQGTRYFMKLTILKSVRRKFVPIHLKIREFRARFDIIKRARIHSQNVMKNKWWFILLFGVNFFNLYYNGKYYGNMILLECNYISRRFTGYRNAVCHKVKVALNSKGIVSKHVWLAESAVEEFSIPLWVVCY